MLAWFAFIVNANHATDGRLGGAPRRKGALRRDGGAGGQLEALGRLREDVEHRLRGR